MKENVRTTVRIATYITAAFLVLGIFTAINGTRATRYENQLNLTYQRAVEDLAAAVQNMNTTLQKQEYTGTAAQMEKLSTQLWRDASIAKQSLSVLPMEGNSMSNTYKLLSQVGEYSLSLSQRAARGEKISDQEKESLSKLRTYCDTLNQQLYTLGQDVLSGQISFESADLAGDLDSADLPALADGFNGFERDFNDYPTLIYDGPFSDHILEKESELLKSSATITKEAARDKAAEAVSRTKDKNISATALVEDGEEAGKMPSYRYRADNVTVSVTKQGGYLCYLMNSRLVGDETISQEEGRKIAREYLTKMGIRSMEESYYETANGILTVNFAYTQRDTTVYPDLIKVSVALDNGEITGYDARGYLMNHQTRSIAPPDLTLEQAKQSVSKELTVTQSRRAVIPSSGQNEVACYEFLCRAKDGQQVLVYVNDSTGVEEQILILQISEDGVLTV